jgi:hypothetical protein
MKFSLSPTIKLKLVLMGFVAVVALALLSIISWNAANVVKRATNDNQAMLEQSQQISDLRVSTIEMVLAAMDSMRRCATARNWFSRPRTGSGSPNSRPRSPN